MPEGDTVARLARRLRPLLEGRTLVHGRLNVPAHATADLAGARVLGVATHGKHLLTRFDLAGEALTLHTHLLMDGDWALLGPGKRLPARLLPDVRVLLVTDEQRTAAGLRMPVVELLRTADEHRATGHLGPDLLDPDLDVPAAAARLAGEPSRPLAAALLDQRLVAGLGNLWANELCFLTGRSPWTPVAELGEAGVARLVVRAARALRASAAGVTGYQVTTGNTRPGQEHWVAGRAGQPCRRCGTRVEVVAEVAGVPEDDDAAAGVRRRTWWCPHCQPGPSPLQTPQTGRTGQPLRPRAQP
ncbi:DNA-formamidopyrimidine glycosylase family protein [Quadrisphaera setariae]|uniref:DNA-(apurinic or apyrimidinic site) lyase n=1 Tax=Quadrisphaera setariae TaxID=2593304 RepID=A0A5C8ZGQ9_9ACTN|nr:DNA-formamidopyrimidine glycosylase family protein [Quadrisphaera setariae]TXR56724.1 Fpg/Nei family DNA glycosylase [Quadrisphaera setariae]